MIVKRKEYKAAPLPFMGQKRRFIKEFSQALSHFSADAIYVDLFGGSGLLSHTVKQVYPNARVIYNDFDGYSERILNIDRTNKLLADLREILKNYPKDKLIKGDIRKQVLNLVWAESEASLTGFVDYITLSSSLLFSMNCALNFEQLSTASLYNKVTAKQYDATNYLLDIEVVSLDYKVLFNQYKDLPNTECRPVVFIIDPPYLSTDNSAYKMYWNLADYLDVLDILKDTNYFYFTSNKSSIVELCEWLDKKFKFGVFKESITIKKSTTINYQSKYVDIMIYKH